MTEDRLRRWSLRVVEGLGFISYTERQDGVMEELELNAAAGLEEFSLLLFGFQTHLRGAFRVYKYDFNEIDNEDANYSPCKKAVVMTLCVLWESSRATQYVWSRASHVGFVRLYRFSRIRQELELSGG